MRASDDLVRVWYVGFCKSKARHWLLDRLGYSHVFAMRKTRCGKSWLIVDPTVSFIEVSAFPVSAMPNVHDYTDEECEVVRYEVRAPTDGGFSVGFGPLTCVTAIMGILGVSSWFIWTPKQLLKYLRNNNGTGYRKG